MSSSSHPNAPDEMDQLVSLQRSGVLSMPEFLRMSREITKTHTDRLSEARGETHDGTSDNASSESEMLVDESGNFFDAAEAATLDAIDGGEEGGSAAAEGGAADELSAAGSFDDEPEDMEVPTESNVEFVLKVGAPVIVRRGGEWAGTITAIGDPDNFLTAGKYQVRYETKSRKGRGYTTTIVQAWVDDNALKKRVVSPRKVQTTSSEGDVSTERASSKPTERPHMRQPDMEQAEEDKHPTMAAHERGRKMQQHDAPVRSLLGERKTKESKVSIQQRLVEFKHQSLTEVDHSIFCQSCEKKIRNDKGTIKTHVKSPTHAANYELWLSKRDVNGEVKEFLFEHFQAHPAEKMASLSLDTLLFRFNVMETILAACLAPASLDVLSGLLKEAVPDTSNMKCFVPKVEAFEFERVRNEIQGQKATFNFDGTTRLGEAIVVLLRWCPADFSGIQMRLATFATTEKHMDGAELCVFINNVLTKVCQVDSVNVVGGTRDSCSTNGTAMRNLKVVMLELQDFLCISHTLSKLGEHINLPTLSKFMTHWLGLVQHHPSAKRLWREETGGEAMEGYSTIRWCSREVVQNELAVKLGTHVSGFVDKLIEREIGEAHPQKMRAILDSELEVLQNDLALSLDLQRVINVVHRMEGDSLVALLAHDEVNALLIFSNSLGDTPHSLPSLARLLRDRVKLANGVAIYEYFEGDGWFTGNIIRVLNGKYKVKYSDGTSIDQSEHEVRQWVDVREDSEWKRLVAAAKAGFDYLKGRLDGTCNNVNYDCRDMWEVLRLLKVFDPSFASTGLNDAMARDLVKIKPLRKMGADLLKELPDYLAATNGFTVDHKDTAEFTKSVLAWWASNGSKFPTWAAAAQIVFSFTPNSAAAERVFSLLKIFFGDTRMLALAEMIQASLMLRYNERKVGLV